MSAVQRAAAFVVAVLVLAIGAVVLLSGADGRIGRGPGITPAASASATSAATAAPSTPPPTRPPGATPEADVLATLAEIEEQVVEIRGLPAPDIGPPEILSREELAAEMEAIFESDYPPEERERDNFVVGAFGLLAPGEDIAELQLELLTDQVLGFYDADDQRMVVVTDTGLDAEAKVTYAHEFTHALQDAAFGLDTLETDAVGEDDRGLARVALIEGDATFTMLAWAIQHLTEEELMEIGGAPVPDTADVPDWMLSQLLFPYLAGQTWVMQLMEATNGNILLPDYDPVDAAYDDPPDSTAQIIDIDKWHDRIEPVEVEVPDLAGALGEDWQEVEVSTIGQATAGIILEHFGVTGQAAAAEGWAGDRYVVARGPDEEFALAWRSVWENKEQAVTFEAAYGTVVDVLEFPAMVTRDGETVLVAHASDPGLLGRTVDAAR